MARSKLQKLIVYMVHARPNEKDPSSKRMTLVRAPRPTSRRQLTRTPWCTPTEREEPRRQMCGVGERPETNVSATAHLHPMMHAPPAEFGVGERPETNVPATAHPPPMVHARRTRRTPPANVWRW